MNYEDYEWKQIENFKNLTDKIINLHRQKIETHKRSQLLANRKIRRKAKSFMSKF